MWSNSLTEWIHFRNSHSIGAVVVQAFMILCGGLVVLGLVYVFTLVFAIAIHHIWYDRDPKRVPDYVKNSAQFSSDSENTDGEANAKADDDSSSASSDDQQARRGSTFASHARKLAALDKFMNHDMDAKLRTQDKK